MIDHLPHERHGLIFGDDHKRQRPTAALAHGHATAPLAGPMLGKAPVDAIGLAVRGEDVTAKVSAVDL